MKKALACAVVLLAGCATYIPVQKESGQLALTYSSHAVGTPHSEVIAFVSPDFASKDADKSNTLTYQIAIPALAGLSPDKSAFVAANQFRDRYKSQFATALQDAVEDMYQKRGFKTKGPFETYDDIAYGDKKAVYLVSTPKIMLYFDQSVTKMACRNGNQVCRSEGTFTLRGELVYRLQEPLTGQSLMTKRFDIGQLGITENYIKEFQVRTQSAGLTGALWDKMTSPDQLIDTTDAAMSDALNRLFADIMPKLDNVLSTEEVMSFKGDIAQLKSMKQY